MAMRFFDGVMYFFDVACLVLGLCNIWRFPYVCFQSGGGTFLIPYLLAMIVCGLPATLLELLFSQFSQRGHLRRWIICPLFQGIGCGMVVITGIVSIYYNVILAWSLYYIFSTFSEFLPWTLCTNEWNTHLCVGVNSRTNSSLLVNGSGLSHMETTTVSSDVKSKMVSSAEEYWSNHLLQMSTGIDDPGSVRWQLLLCLAGAWVLMIVYFIRPIKSINMIRGFAVGGFYLVLISLLIRGSLLPGAAEGIKYYFLPQWERLLDIKVWRNAVAQAFFSLGIGWGRMTSVASFNRFNNNCYRDAVVIFVANCLANLFIGFVIFMFLGNMANETNLPVSDVVKGGPGLAIMVYTKAVSTMPGSQLCSAVFFLSLFLLGLINQMDHMHAVFSAIYEAFPRVLMLPMKIALCCAGLVLGISCITQGGVYVLALMDWYIASIPLMVLVVAEVLVLAWIYGVNRLYDDLEMMIGYRVSPVWKATWLVATPLFVIVLLIGGLINFSPVTPGQTSYPAWSQVIGWIIALCPVIPIPVGMVITIRKEEGTTFKQKLISATKPRKEWKSSHEEEEEEEACTEKKDSEERKNSEHEFVEISTI